MAVSLNGVTADELWREGSGQFTISRERGMEGHRFFRVAWEDKWTFLIGLLGGVQVLGGGVRRVTPAAPFEPGSYYRAIDAEVEPEVYRGVDSDGYASYRSARVHAIYRIPDYNEEDEDDPEAPLWIQGSAVSRTEYLVVDSHQFTWASDGKRASKDRIVPFGLPVIYTDYAFTRYNMAGFDEEDYEALMGGKVNATAFLGRAAGTLRFGGYSPERTVNVLGEFSGITLTIHLHYREKPWKYFYRGEGAPAGQKGWDILKVGGADLFTEVEFGDTL